MIGCFSVPVDREASGLAVRAAPEDQEASVRQVWPLQGILAVLKRQVPEAQAPAVVREEAVSAADVSVEGVAFRAADAADVEASAGITPTHLEMRAATGAASTTATSL